MLDSRAMSQPLTNGPYPNASLTRRLAAICYDAFLIAALIMIAGFVAVTVIGHGNSVKGTWFQLYIYLVVLGFFVTFWRIKGQTLGMQVWRIRTVNGDGQIMSYAQCLTRFLAATLSLVCATLGFWWMLVDRDRLMWHDRLSGTRVIYLGSKPYASEKEPSAHKEPPANKEPPAH